MRKSAVYFFIALSLLSLGLTLVPHVFSQTQNIKIVSYSYYTDYLGNLDVVGQIQNDGPNVVNPVILTGSIYSPGGVDQADSYPTQAWVAYLAPQQEAPFYMQFPHPNNSPDGTWYSLINAGDITNVTLTVAQAKATSSYQYPDLKITSSSGTIINGGAYSGAYMVNGVIQNTGSQTASNITVVGTFYNSTGTVVGVGYTNYLTPATLAPSGTLSFQIAALDLNQSQVPSNLKISKYSLLVQTELPILQGTPPIITPSPESSSSSPQKGVNSNGSSNSVVLYAVVIVIVILAVAGTILALIRRKPHQTVKSRPKARKP